MLQRDLKYVQKYSECARSRHLIECDGRVMIGHGLVNYLNSTAVFHSVLKRFVRTEWCRNAAEIFTMEVKIISKTGKEAQQSRLNGKTKLIIFCNCQCLVQLCSFLEVTQSIKNAACPCTASTLSSAKETTETQTVSLQRSSSRSFSRKTKLQWLHNYAMSLSLSGRLLLLKKLKITLKDIYLNKHKQYKKNH